MADDVDGWEEEEVDEHEVNAEAVTTFKRAALPRAPLELEVPHSTSSSSSSSLKRGPSMSSPLSRRSSASASDFGLCGSSSSNSAFTVFPPPPLPVLVLGPSENIMKHVLMFLVLKGPILD